MPKDTWRRNPQGPQFIVGVTNFIHRAELPRHANRAAMYRCVLQHLRLLPDPVIWAFVIPAMRKVCSAAAAAPSTALLKSGESSTSGGETSGHEELLLKTQMERERKATLAKAKEILNELRAAVACHPHVLQRLIRQSYGQMGKHRHQIFRRIEATSPRSNIPRQYEEKLGPGRPPIPNPLLPLVRRTKKADMHLHDYEDANPTSEREVKEQTQRQIRIQWLREYETVELPLAFPKGSNVLTGDEGLGLVQTLQSFAKVGHAYDQYGPPLELPPISHYSERELPTEPALNVIPLPAVVGLTSFERLKPHWQRMFPQKLKPTMREPPLPKPPRHETRANPKTWKNPIRLTPRLITRTYQRIWDTLPWTRPKTEDPNGEWVKCTYEEILLWEQGRFEEMRQAARDSTKFVDPAKFDRMTKMTEDEHFWKKYGKGRKEAKAIVDRLLDPKKRSW